MTTMNGRIEALWAKRAHRGPMDSVQEATLVAGQGMQGSVGRSRRRQVTILAREAWAAATEKVGLNPGPVSRRANILVSGVELAHTRGRVLLVGSCRIAIGGELTPCERMDEAAPGLRRALEADWRGGVFGQVLDGGTVRVGDRVAWEMDCLDEQSSSAVSASTATAR
jgi:MOSC domain-containing protein YiiM